MAKETIVVGLDIGTTKTVAIAGMRNEYGTVDILGIGTAPSTGVSRGDIDNIDKTVDSIRQAVSACEKHANVDIKEVYVGISGPQIQSFERTSIITLSNKNQEISQTDLDRLRNEMHTVSLGPGREIIHVIPIDYNVDEFMHIKDPIGMSGVRLEGRFHIVTGLSSSLRNLHKVVSKAGLTVSGIVLQPIASALSVLMDDEREAGVCLVDIGGGTTDVVIYQEHTLRHSAVIPLGGNVITNDIVAGCQLMRKHAEQLKTRYGSALAQAVHEDEYLSIQGLRHRPEKEIRKFTLAQIIQARMEELMELVMREIERAGYGHKLAGGIVLTGAGSLLHHSRELTEYVTGIDTRVGFPNEQLAQGMAMEANQPTYSTAVGLMLHGMKEEETLSERSRRGRRANGKRPTTTSNNAQSNRGEGIFSVMERIFKSTVDDVID